MGWHEWDGIGGMTCVGWHGWDDISGMTCVGWHEWDGMDAMAFLGPYMDMESFSTHVTHPENRRMSGGISRVEKTLQLLKNLCNISGVVRYEKCQITSY